LQNAPSVAVRRREASHALSIRLSPLHVRVVGSERESLEKFWQNRKCLAVWEDA
jgi:hypothetical protein